ncbi:MAG: 2-oxoacid ferredoxin oxidoreductase [Chloroflexi bacterium]|nr:2-oxoacid ferredoxin oxidoreductase [Chloroflexota bacterium]
MPTLDDLKGKTPAWCPGCGNFQILRAFQQAILQLALEPWRFIVVSGIGQAAKFPHYIRCHTFNGLHGRALPVATGIRLANHTMPVFVTTGDGDCYGEGGNHLIHAMRRNVKVTLIVHDNQIYGLTKGQASPTTAMGMVTKNQPFGSQSEPLSPLAMAALDCSFVARGFSGEPDHLTSLIVEAARWPGFALIDVLQPCVSFNPVNTLEWYAQRVYHLEEGYDPEDRLAAFSRSLEWEKRIPLGILYRHSRLTLEEQAPSLRGEPLTRQTYDRVRLEGSLAELA